MFLIKLPYWLGIIADTLWAVALFFPSVFGLLVGNSDFNPEIQTRLIMGIGGSLMAGWTILLLWAVKNPIERRIVALITACPVVFGLFIISLVGLLNGNNSNVWILIKTSILIILFICSFLLAKKIAKDQG